MEEESTSDVLRLFGSMTAICKDDSIHLYISLMCVLGAKYFYANEHFPKVLCMIHRVEKICVDKNYNGQKIV